MKYAMIHVHEGSVAPSGYHEWRNLSTSSTEQKRAALDAHVQAAFVAENGPAGSPRVVRGLKAQGHRCCRHQVAKSMRRQGLRAKAARKFKATTNSHHSLPVAPNLLQQDFSAEHPNQKWVSDITYISTEDGWLYLAVVLDLFSRRVVGWSMSARMSATLVCDALRMAILNRQQPRGVIVHSDRGSQYCSKEHRKLLDNYGMICSMSEKGNCYDNAAMKSWNHSLKVEAIHGERFDTREGAIAHVFDYIEVYYNRQRLHSRLGYFSPEAFELAQVA